MNERYLQDNLASRVEPDDLAEKEADPKQTPEEEQTVLTKVSFVQKEKDPKVLANRSFETLDTEIESENEPSPDRISRKRRLRWSDEEGKALEHVSLFHETRLEISIRVVLLLLHPSKRSLFEFIHCQFMTDDRLLVSDVLDQIPSLATFSFFKKKKTRKFRSLIRDAPPHHELINVLALQDYDLRNGEILVAVPQTAKPRESLARAHRLLQSDDKLLRKAVKRARMSGRALRNLYSSEQWLQVRDSINKAAKEERAVERKAKRKQVPSLETSGTDNVPPKEMGKNSIDFEDSPASDTQSGDKENNGIPPEEAETGSDNGQEANASREFLPKVEGEEEEDDDRFLSEKVMRKHDKAKAGRLLAAAERKRKEAERNEEKSNMPADVVKAHKQAKAVVRAAGTKKRKKKPKSKQPKNSSQSKKTTVSSTLDKLSCDEEAKSEGNLQATLVEDGSHRFTASSTTSCAANTLPSYPEEISVENEKLTVETVASVDKDEYEGRVIDELLSDVWLDVKVSLLREDPALTKEEEKPGNVLKETSGSTTEEITSTVLSKEPNGEVGETRVSVDVKKSTSELAPIYSEKKVEDVWLNLAVEDRSHPAPDGYSLARTINSTDGTEAQDDIQPSATVCRSEGVRPFMCLDDVDNLIHPFDTLRVEDCFLDSASVDDDSADDDEDDEDADDDEDEEALPNDRDDIVYNGEDYEDCMVCDDGKDRFPLASETTLVCDFSESDIPDDLSYPIEI